MKIAVFRPYRTAIFFARVRCSARFLRDIHQEFSETEAIKTTGLAGGMHHAFKAMLPAARHGL